MDFYKNQEDEFRFTQNVHHSYMAAAAHAAPAPAPGASDFPAPDDNREEQVAWRQAKRSEAREEAMAGLETMMEIVDGEGEGVEKEEAWPEELVLSLVRTFRRRLEVGRKKEEYCRENGRDRAALQALQPNAGNFSLQRGLMAAERPKKKRKAPAGGGGPGLVKNPRKGRPNPGGPSRRYQAQVKMC